MEKRIFVVLDKQKELAGVASKLAADLAKLPDCRVVVARPEADAGEAPTGTSLVAWPATLKNDAAIRNWINSQAGIKTARFLHVVDGSTELLKDPSEFLAQLEKTMDVLDYSFWLATSCDSCNYLYQKFCPRVVIALDAPEYQKLGLPAELVLTSHSNLQWVAYDLEKTSQSELEFDEDFTIAMYEIIEALARRKAKKNSQPYFMNQYVTVPAEAGVFRVSKLFKVPELDQLKLKSEDLVFKAKNVQHSADNAIDEVLMAIKTKLDEKAI